MTTHEAIKAPKGHEALYERLELTEPLPPDHELERWSERSIKWELHRHLTASKAILERAATEKRDRTSEEDAELARLDGDMDRLERAANAKGETRDVPRLRLDITDPAARRDLRATSDRGGLAWIDRETGREVRSYSLARGERLSSAFPVEHPLSIGKAVIGMATGNWRNAEAEQRAVTVGVAASGGYLVPESMGTVIDLAASNSVVLQAGAETVNMPAGTLKLGRQLTDPAATWYFDEVRTSGLTETTPTFGLFTLTAHTLAILCRLSIEWAEDAPNGPDLVERAIGRALGLEIDRAVLFGIPGGAWGGLRNLSADSANDLNEQSMGTNGAAITDFSKFVTAIQNVLEANYAGPLDALSMVMAPRTWGTMEGFKEATTNAPLAAPASVKNLKKLISTQCPITETQGNVSTASTVFIGDFTKILLGIRTAVTIEATRTGGDAMSRLHLLVRGYIRADWTLTLPKFITRVVGIIP